MHHLEKSIFQMTDKSFLLILLGHALDLSTGTPNPHSKEWAEG